MTVVQFVLHEKLLLQSCRLKHFLNLILDGPPMCAGHESLDPPVFPTAGYIYNIMIKARSPIF